MATKFCWRCSRKLRPPTHATRVVQGREVTLHVSCAEALDREKPVDQVPGRLLRKAGAPGWEPRQLPPAFTG